MPTLVAPTPLPGDISSDALLRHVLDAALTGIQLLRPVYAPDGASVVDFAYVYNNPAGLRMLGFEQQPMGTLATIFPHTREAGVLAFYQRAFDSDEPLTYAINYQADGIDNYFSFSAQRSGAYLLVNFTDTRDQSRSAVEQALRESQAREQERTRQLAEQQEILRHIIGQVPAAVATLSGPEHRFTFFNEQYQRLVGHRAVYNVPVAEALPETQAQGFIALLDRVYHTERPYIGNETAIELMQLDGDFVQRFVNFIYQPLRNHMGYVNGILVFAVDVTEQGLARQQVQALNQQLATLNEELTCTNEELNDSNRQLTRTNVDLDTFVYTASHDLKAPITNIEGLLEALLYELPADVRAAESISQLLGMMQGAIERFQYTLNQLTDISRLQHAQTQPAEQVQLATVVEDVRLDLQPLISSTQAQVQVELSPKLYVLFSPKNLRSVVYNLLSNAIKYHHPDRLPIVQLHATCQEQTVLLTVTDNGLGLSLEQQQCLFELFQRAHTHVEGSGVGLYMVKRIVDNAGGIIAIESQLGQGSTFSVTFPAGRPQ